MEELFTLQELLLQGDIAGALAVVDELEEISRDDKISNISSYGVILLLYLIKQQAEKRTTRSWEVSIQNSVLEIQKKNKRRRPGGVYLKPEELRSALEEADRAAINKASLEVNEGAYTIDELAQMINKEEIFNQAIMLLAKELYANKATYN